MFKRRLLSIFLFLLGATFDTSAADIIKQSFKNDDPKHTQGIIISGELLFSDVATFKSISDGVPDGSLVLLSSPGGAVVAGIEIGREIRKRHFTTGVIDMCASACALSWLGGEVRSFYKDAKVGFHVAYSDGVEKRESGMGNALVGLYVGELGYKDNVVKYITSAAPDEMQWITPRDAQLLGIDVLVIDSNKENVASAPQAGGLPNKKLVQDPSDNPERSSTEFVLNIINSNMMDGPLALNSVLQNYSPLVDYFGNQKTLAEVYADKSKYFERWPVRTVRVRPETVTTKCQDNTCTVSGVYEWAVRNIVKNKVKSGTALFNYKVDLLVSPKIVGEAGEVIKKD